MDLDVWTMDLDFKWRLILNDVLHAVKVVARFYAARYEHAKRVVVGCANVCFKFP